MYEGAPQVGSFGFDSALEPDAGVFTIASVGFTHTFGADERHGGTTSLGVWHHSGVLPETVEGPEAGLRASNGVPRRDNDTVGIGAGAVHLARPRVGPRPDGTELFVEAFYKARFTHWISLEPDFQFFRHPGGDGRDAVVLGTRFKVKL